AGERPEWNATEQSRHHRVIPLVGDSFRTRFPMFSQLFRELGVLLPLKSSSTSDAVIGRTGQHDDVFYISDALGSSLVPDQQDFVIPYGHRNAHIEALEGLLTVQEQTVAASMARRRRVEEALVDTRPS
ncbi:MAG TPA: hypothetical protein VHQ67_03555, partial [Nitrospiraceae bacterium]|nr:hypothetical protein [Nitrospiraceae bacterium]